MGLPAFDTLEFVDELEKSGIPEKQARAISVAVRKVHDSSDVATKADIAGLRHDMDAKHESLRRDLAEAEERTDAKLDKLGTELHHEISDLRKDMDVKHESLRKDIFHEIRELESRLMVKLGGLVVAGIVVIAALPAIFKYLHVG